MFDALFTTTTEYKKLSHALSGKGACALFGLPASGRAQMYAALCRQLDKPLCIVTPGEAEATRFAADLNTLGIPAAVFPARDYVLRPIEGTAREYEYRRLAVLGELVGGRLRAVAVPAEALTQFTTPKRISAPTPAPSMRGILCCGMTCWPLCLVPATPAGPRWMAPASSLCAAILWIFLLPTRKCRFVWNFGVMRSIPCTPLT